MFTSASFSALLLVALLATCTQVQMAASQAAFAPSIAPLVDASSTPPIRNAAPSAAPPAQPSPAAAARAELTDADILRHLLIAHNIRDDQTSAAAVPLQQMASPTSFSSSPSSSFLSSSDSRQDEDSVDPESDVRNAILTRFIEAALTALATTDAQPQEQLIDQTTCTPFRVVLPMQTSPDDALVSSSSSISSSSSDLNAVMDAMRLIALQRQLQQVQQQLQQMALLQFMRSSTMQPSFSSSGPITYAWSPDPDTRIAWSYRSWRAQAPTVAAYY